jgi:cytochrome c5
MRLVLCGFFAATVLVAAGGAQAADGQAVYNQNCGMCHNNIAPKLGDKAAWAPLIKQGTDTLVASVIKGKGAMPARAGQPSLSDADIKASVEYIVSKSQ